MATSSTSTPTSSTTMKRPQSPFRGILVSADADQQATRRQKVCCTRKPVHVSFATTVKGRHIEGLSDLTQDEKASIWRTAIDTIETKRGIMNDVRATQDLDLQKYTALDKTEDDDKHCRRGLEMFLCHKFKETTSMKRQLVVRSVLSEQEQQRRTGQICRKTLADISCRVSRESKKAARIRAKEDTSAARKALGMATTVDRRAVMSRTSSWDKRVEAFKKDSSRRYRERQGFVKQTLAVRNQKRIKNSSAQAAKTA